MDEATRRAHIEEVRKRYGIGGDIYRERPSRVALDGPEVYRHHQAKRMQKSKRTTNRGKCTIEELNKMMGRSKNPLEPRSRRIT